MEIVSVVIEPLQKNHSLASIRLPATRTGKRMGASESDDLAVPDKVLPQGFARARKRAKQACLTLD
jgi:hypothetical protein